MKIHRVKEGEELAEIAKKYEISEERIYENNTGLEKGLCTGRELLIMRPTRTYIAKAGDTPSSVAKRFGIRKHTLLMNNPSLLTNGMSAGREYAIRYPTPPLGSAAANGYFFADTELSKLEHILPYLTYLTVGNCKITEGSLSRLFSPSSAVQATTDSGKVPLMRVFDGGTGEFYTDKKKRLRLAEELVALALADGFRGITLSSFNSARNFTAEFAEFLIELRKSMIGCDLILFMETDESLPAEISDLADGAVFMYSKHGVKNPPSFQDGERRILNEFADKTESSKSMLYFPSDAFSDGNYIPYDKAFSHISDKSIIEHDEESGLCRFSHKKGTAVFASLENTKAKLELCSELGFMGAAFDIKSVPREYLLMWSALFAPVHYRLPYSFPM